MIGFFDDSISTLPPKPLRPPSVSRGGRYRAAGGSAVMGNPCDGCPMETRAKVLPTLPEGLEAIVLGVYPGPEEEKRGLPFVAGSGREVRQALQAAGLDPTTKVGYGNLTRCCSPTGSAEDKDWKKGATRCRRLLDRDLARFPGVPLLVLGTEPLAHMLGNAKARITGYRGLWVDAPDGRKLFGARHPAGILRERDPVRRAALLQQFQSDIGRFGARFQAGAAPEADPLPPILRSPEQARVTLDWLTVYPGPWAFDIETFDAGASPSRKDVSTDPCHPDFRVRGVAVAVSPSQGFWLEFGGRESLAQGPEDARPAPRTGLDSRIAAWQGGLGPAFGSAAEKLAFNGHFDEEGLVYSGWVPQVRNRRGDGMLALIALGNGAHDSLKLEMATADLLGKSQGWSGLDKGRMGDLATEDVARGAVKDACHTFELCMLLHERLKRGEYLG